MLVFIDESGDPGFKLDKGASQVFVVAMVIFDRASDAVDTQRAIENLKLRLGYKGEFKFNKSNDPLRDTFFNIVADCPFYVRAIVIRKELIYSNKLKSSKEKFYEYFVRKMMEYDGSLIKNAKVVIDGSGDREFKKYLTSSLRKNLNPNAIKSLKMKNSNDDVLIKLADMCVGAIARSYKTDKKNSGRWRQMLSKRINDVWDFK